MTLAIPPLYDSIVDEEGKANLNWSVFFQSISDGDTGLNWTPNFVSLGTSGTPEFSGRYYRISKNIVLFTVLVTPGTSTTSTAGTTYIDNFPLNFTADSACWAMSGGLGSASGHIVSSNNRIFTPAWSAVTVPLTVLGLGVAS